MPSLSFGAGSTKGLAPASPPGWFWRSPARFILLWFQNRSYPWHSLHSEVEVSVFRLGDVGFYTPRLKCVDHGKILDAHDQIWILRLYLRASILSRSHRGLGLASPFGSAGPASPGYKPGPYPASAKGNSGWTYGSLSPAGAQIIGSLANSPSVAPGSLC